MVQCHAGFKADEYPMSFIWADCRYEIHEIIDRWYQTDLNPEIPAADYFKVTTKEGGHFILRHEISKDQWYIV